MLVALPARRPFDCYAKAYPAWIPAWGVAAGEVRVATSVVENRTRRPPVRLYALYGYPPSHYYQYCLRVRLKFALLLEWSPSEHSGVVVGLLDHVGVSNGCSVGGAGAWRRSA